MRYIVKSQYRYLHMHYWHFLLSINTDYIKSHMNSNLLTNQNFKNHLLQSLFLSNYILLNTNIKNKYVLKNTYKIFSKQK